MHRSIIAEHKERYLLPLKRPVCDIIDFHMHVCGAEEDEKYIKIAQDYGVCKAGAMLHGIDAAELLRRYNGFFFPIEWLRMPEPGAGKEWVKREVQRITTEAEAGLVALKLLSTCKKGRPDVWIDHPCILEVLQEAARLGLFVYIHIAEPSLWWPERYKPEIVGNKVDYHKPVENILQTCPQLQVVGAHLGGYPEDLQFLSWMLEEYENYSLDMSATKWIVRELGRDVKKSREFVVANQQRLYFGSDLVAFLSDGEEDYYLSRFSVLRHLFESNEVIPSMIADPDAIGVDYPRGPEVRGLGLPEDVLSNIYYNNAYRLIHRSEDTVC